MVHTLAGIKIHQTLAEWAVCPTVLAGISKWVKGNISKLCFYDFSSLCESYFDNLQLNLLDRFPALYQFRR